MKRVGILTAGAALNCATLANGDQRAVELAVGNSRTLCSHGS